MVTPSPYMVDWLTVELPDPVGLPVNAGEIVRVSRDGEVEWTTPARLQVQGSWSSSMTFRAVGCEYTDEEHRDRAQWELNAANGGNVKESGLVVSGNPAKFVNGHNLFGTDCPIDLARAALRKAAPSIWPGLTHLPEIDYGEGLISRIDLTASWLLDRAVDVMPVLRAMEESVWCPYRGKGVFDAGGSTLYFGRTDKGKRAKDWALKLYWKGAEVTAHPLPGPAAQVPGLHDELARTIRVELTLRTPELKKLGLRKLANWSPAKVAEIWELYMSKLPFGHSTVNLDTADLDNLGLKPRHVHAIAAWKAGNDLRKGMSRASFYRLRSEIRDATGHDIAALRPTSNVVPLRRLINISPAPYPRWADQLSEALAKVA